MSIVLFSSRNLFFFYQVTRAARKRPGKYKGDRRGRGVEQRSRVNWPPRNFLSRAAFDLERAFLSDTAILALPLPPPQRGRRNSLWHWMDSRGWDAPTGCVSRCEFMGLGHPLSKVYSRRPWSSRELLCYFFSLRLAACLSTRCPSTRPLLFPNKSI